jgi:integrase
MSVRKRTWTTRRGEQREAWVLDYAVNGVRHLETFERKKDADAREAQVTVDVGKGIHVAPNKTPTVTEAGRQWIEACEAAGLERTTTDGYRQHLKLHIEPLLGGVKLAQLSAPMIRQFEDDLRSGRRDGHKRSADMTKRVLISLGTMLADAQERGHVAMNAVRSLRRGRKRGKERQAERRKRGKLKIGTDIPSREEIRGIIGKLSDRWRPIILTAAFSGLRASELRGLRWSDIDLKTGKLHVSQRADRYRAIGAPKSESGERAIPLPPMVVNTLREWKLKCPKGEHDLAFPSGAGQIENHANILHRGFEPAQIAAGVVDGKGRPKYALHALRHFFASWCINREKDGGLGLPIKMVQERLGHSSINLTADLYSHLFPSRDDGAELQQAEKFFLA